MDVSSDYVKMCGKAPKELWDLVSRRHGTFIVWRSFIGIIKPSLQRKPMSDFASIIPETLVTRTWLRRDEDIMVLGNSEYGTDKGTPLYAQDQLQEMVIQKDWAGIPLFAVDQLETFRRETSFRGYPYYQKWFATQEQLWLAFVMKEKYNKVWNGEEWLTHE